MSMVVIRGAVRACDIAIICLLGFAVALFYVDEPVIIGSTGYMAAIAMTAVVDRRRLRHAGPLLAHGVQLVHRQMPRVLLAWTAAFALLLAGVFFLKVGHDFSRVWFAAWYVSRRRRAARLAPGRRQLCRATGRGRAASIAGAAIYGGGAISEKLIGELEIDVDSDIRIMRRVRRPRRRPRRPHHRRLSPPRRPRSSSSPSPAHALDLVIVALPITAEKRVLQLTRSCRCCRPTSGCRPAPPSSASRRGTYSFVGNVP